MKYHTRLSTLFISLSVVLVFALVSICIILFFDFTSPTLLITNSIFDSLKNSNSDISISFSSIERNLRDRVYINDFSIMYKGEDLLTLKQITISRGLFSLIGYLLDHRGILSIEASDGLLYIPESFLAQSSESGNTQSSESILDRTFDLKLPEALSSWGFELDVENLDLIIGDMLSVDGITLNGYFDHGLDGMVLTTDIPKIEVQSGETLFSAENTNFSLREESGLNLSLSVDMLRLERENAELNINQLLFLTNVRNIESFSLSDLPLDIVFDSLHGSYNGASLITGPLVLHEESRRANLVLDTPIVTFGNVYGSVSSINVSTDDFSLFDYSIRGLEFFEGEESILQSKIISGNVDRSEGIFNLDLPYLESSLVRGITEGLYERITLRDFKVDVSYIDGFAIENSSLIDIYASDGGLNDVMMDESISLDIENGVFNSADIIFKSREGDLNDIDIELSASRDKVSGALNVDNLTLNGLFSDGIFFDFDIQSLNLEPYRPILTIFVPAISQYIAENTALSGSILVDLDPSDSSSLGYSGPYELDLSLSDVRFNNYEFDIDLESNGSFDDRALRVDALNLELSPVGLSFVGTVDYSTLLPSGDFTLYSPRTETLFMDATLDLTYPGLYNFFGTIPSLSDTFIRGTVDFRNEGVITSVSTLSLFSNLYPFSLMIDLESRSMFISHESFEIIADFAHELNISAMFDSFSLNSETTEVAPSSISGSIQFYFDFVNQLFDIEIPSLELTSLGHLPGSPSIYLSLVGNNSGITVDDFDIKYQSLPDLSGSVNIDFSSRSGSLYVHSDDEVEEYMFSIINDNGTYSAVLKGANINLDRFSLDGMRGDLLLAGKANRLEDFDFSGSFNASSVNSEEGRNITAELSINESELVLRNILYSKGTTSMSIPLISFNSTTGILRVDDFAYSLAIHKTDRDYPITLLMSLEGKWEERNTLFQSITGLVTSSGEGLTLTASLDYLNVDNVLITPQRTFSAYMSDGVLNMEGELLSGIWRVKDKWVDLNINLHPVAALSCTGTYDPESFELFLGIDEVNLMFVDFSMKPTLIHFDPAFFISGNVTVTRDSNGFSLYGELGAEQAEFEVFYLPDQKIILHNPTFLAWGTDITSVLCDATVLNTTTYERTPGKISLGLYFNESMVFDSWDLEVYIDDGNEISFRLPSITTNIDIIGKVSGYYRIEGNMEYIKNYGDVTVDDVILSIGMRELPDWWYAGIPSEIDFNILMRDNAQFVFPLGPNPILVANIQDNTRVRYNYVPGKGMTLSGDINLRSGEIYYFQKYFYITEGSLVFRDGGTGFNPRVNLRARLRDFDSNGDPVDIYLVLRDATLDNISPTFESNPSLETNEIMSILGQAILPTSAYGEDAIRSVISVATASVDILSKFGIINSMDSGLSTTIRDSLFLDTFSLHSNILSNMISDAVSLMGVKFYSPYSPFARYLDGTTLFMGKYITQNLYFQAMLHLSAERTWSQNRFSFIAEDLVLDTELSLEWTNDMFTAIFFTQPVNLTAYSILDGFGFTLMKRLVF